jgi:hypothetical protein
MAEKLNEAGFVALSNLPSRNLQRLTRLHAHSALIPFNPFGLLPTSPRRKTELNVHVDPINWRRKSSHDPDVIAAQVLGALRMRRKRYTRPSMPIGIMTHHLVHDDAIWRNVRELLERLTQSPAITFPDLSLLMEECAA